MELYITTLDQHGKPFRSEIWKHKGDLSLLDITEKTMEGEKLWAEP